MVEDDSFKKFQLRITQNYSGNQIVINVLQEDLYNYAKGSVPYYQYGRFAPAFGFITGKTDAKYFYNAAGVKASLSSLTGNSIADPVYYYLSNTLNTLEQAKTNVRNVAAAGVYDNPADGQIILKSVVFEQQRQRCKRTNGQDSI